MVNSIKEFDGLFDTTVEENNKTIGDADYQISKIIHSTG